MGLYELRCNGAGPEFPVRCREDLLQIIKRWEDGPWEDGDDEIDWAQLEQDIHALAYIVMEHIKD